MIFTSPLNALAYYYMLVFENAKILDQNIVISFQVWHKLYYFHFCQNFQKKNNIEYQKFWKFNQGSRIWILN